MVATDDFYFWCKNKSSLNCGASSYFAERQEEEARTTKEIAKLEHSNVPSLHYKLS
jgi:hypothetical protein